MAIWQYRLILLPEAVLLRKYEILPGTIQTELAEDFPWWSDVQPRAGFEKQIDLILPPAASWSESMRMWGQNSGDDAYVIYTDETMKVVEEISFRINASKISQELVKDICEIARNLKCVFLTSEYEILAPDESMVLENLNRSTASRFVQDPAATLQGVDQEKLQKRIDYITRHPKDNPPK